jgi:hypothetical protein
VASPSFPLYIYIHIYIYIIRKELGAMPSDRDSSSDGASDEGREGDRERLSMSGIKGQGQGRSRFVYTSMKYVIISYI